MAEDDDSPAYQAGRQLGEAIWACFEAIASIDGITTTEAIDGWVSTYVAQRIEDEANQ